MIISCFRSFGRFTLVGTHTINSIHKFLYTPSCSANSNSMANVTDNAIKNYYDRKSIQMVKLNNALGKTIEI